MPRAVRLPLLLATVALIASCGKSSVTSSAPSAAAPSAVATDGGVRLQWNPVTGQDVTGYRVYYGTASGTYLQPYGQGLASTATTYTMTGLAGAQRYFFAVTATNSLGKESGYSNEASVDVP
jgi:hypothetical protein